MIWDELTRKAFEIACKAHAGQVDRGGVPYIFHPLHVADQMPNSTLGAVSPPSSASLMPSRRRPGRT